MNIKTYTKKDLSLLLSKNKGISLKESKENVEEIFKIIKEILTEDSPYVRIEIRNFGVFESKPTRAKPRARNPRTNEEIYVPAHKNQI